MASLGNVRLGLPLYGVDHFHLTSRGALGLGETRLAMVRHAKPQSGAVGLGALRLVMVWRGHGKANR